MDRRRFLIGVLAFLSTGGYSEVILSKLVCEGGINRFGDYVPCKKVRREPGLSDVEYPVDARRVGKVEKVEKNLDGSVTVWRHGSPDTEEWRQTNETAWERTR